MENLSVSLLSKSWKKSITVRSFFDLVAGFQFDYVFDWTILKYQQAEISVPPSRGLVSVIKYYRPSVDSSM